MKNSEMKSLLKSFKSYKQAFSIPEPDADFENRMLKSLRKSPEWKKRSLWMTMAEKFDFFRIELTGFRLMGATCAVVVILGSVRYFEVLQTRVATQTQLGASNVARSPELNSMLQRGGEKALQAWIMVNGDLTAQVGPGTVENTASLSADEQKRIISELEKKWAPAL